MRYCTIPLHGYLAANICIGRYKHASDMDFGGLGSTRRDIGTWFALYVQRLVCSFFHVKRKEYRMIILGLMLSIAAGVYPYGALAETSGDTYVLEEIAVTATRVQSDQATR